MPRTPGPIVAGLVLIAVVGWLLVGTARRVHFSPAASLRDDIASEQSRIDAYERVVGGALRVRDDLDEIVARTLGGTVEEADHHLRTRLNRIAESVQLAEASVGTGGATSLRSPARSQLPRSLRNEIDFVELEGWIAGEGTFAQIVRLVDELDAEPWLKRLTNVRFDPRENGERFKVTVRLVTPFIPGRGPDAAPGTAILTAYDPSRLAPFASLIAANPFRVPPPLEVEVVVAPEPTPVPEPVEPEPEPFPWEQWALTGIAAGPDGDEAWLLNRSSGESRRLAIGHAIDAAVLDGADADWAEFRLGDTRFRVQVGANLSDRTRIAE